MGKLLSSLVILILVLVVGTVGYVSLEQMRVIDALYMTVITITTVGFGEIHPLSDHGKIFTIFLIMVGIGIFALFVSMFAEWLLQKGVALNNLRKNNHNNVSPEMQEPVSKDVLSFLSQDSELRMGIIQSKSAYNKKTKIDILGQYGFIIVGLKDKKTGNFNLNVPLNKKIKQTDTLLIMGNDQDLKNAKKAKRLF